MDTFGKPESFSKVFEKLVESYVIDAVDWFDPEKEHKVIKSAVTDFMKASQAPEIEEHPSIRLGTDLRIESKKVTGFSLILNNEIIHLSVFSHSNDQKQGKSTSRMERYTQRRRNRVY